MLSQLRLLLSAIAVLSLLTVDLTTALAQSNSQQQWQRQQQQQQEQFRRQQEEAARRVREAQEAAQRAQQERMRQEQIRQQQLQQQQRQQQLQQQTRQRPTQTQPQQAQPGQTTNRRPPVQSQSQRATVSGLGRTQSGAAQRPAITAQAQSALKAKLAALKSKAANDNQRGGSGGKPPTGYGGSGSGGKPPSSLQIAFKRAAFDKTQAQKVKLQKAQHLRLAALRTQKQQRESYHQHLILLQVDPKRSWADQATLVDHYDRHGKFFGATSQDDYARKAAIFFQESQRNKYHTKIDKRDGTIRVYDPVTNTFASYTSAGLTKTFYKPNPSVHGFSTNMEYWNNQKGELSWQP